MSEIILRQEEVKDEKGNVKAKIEYSVDVNDVLVLSEFDDNEIEQLKQNFNKQDISIDDLHKAKKLNLPPPSKKDLLTRKAILKKRGYSDIEIDKIIQELKKRNLIA